jgi:hypothetical protein
MGQQRGNLCVLPCVATSFKGGHTHIYTHTHTHAHTYALLHTHHIHTHTYTYAHTHAHAHAHKHTHRHKYTHTDKHPVMLGTASHFHLTSIKSSPSSGSMIN